MPPGTPLELLGVVSPGRSLYVEYDLLPGDYVIACFMPDLDRGGLPHALEGMVDTFTIPSRGPRR
jgi:hypothetical protein